MGFPYFDMKFSTRFPYSKVVLLIFFLVNEFVITAFSSISAHLEMDFLHLKWFWFNIRFYSVVVEYPLRILEVKGSNPPEAESYQRL